MHFPFERQLGKLVPFFSRIPGFPLHVVRGNPIPLFCVILGYNFPLLRRLYGDNSLQSLLDEWPCATWPRGKSATLVQHASVAQGIEHRSPKAGVDGSNPPGGTREYDGVAGAAPFLVCGGRRAARPWGMGICFLECAAVNLSRVVQRELLEAAEELSAVDLEVRNHLFDIVLGDSELR